MEQIHCLIYGRLWLRWYSGRLPIRRSVVLHVKVSLGTEPELLMMLRHWGVNVCECSHDEQVAPCIGHQRVNVYVNGACTV